MRRILFLLSAVAFNYVADSLASRPKPNVLFIVIDDLRPLLGCYGDKIAISPNIDRLAKRSVLFEKAYTQQALCAPSRNSFLTSRRPDTTRLYDFYSYWREAAGNFTTLPQYFKSHGYHSHSVGKIFHPGISSNFSDDMPYSWSQTPYHPSTQKYKDKPVCRGKDGGLHDNLLCPVHVPEQPEKTLPDIQSADEAVRFIKDHNSSNQTQPFFLCLGFHKPHVPFKFPEEFLDFYPLSEIHEPDNPDKPVGMPDISWNPFMAMRRREDIAALNLSFPYGPVPPLHSRLIKQHYYASVTYMDSLVGKVLQTLERTGLNKNTIVALIGDHGWSLGEHQEWAKFSNFEVAVRVPLILHLPTGGQKSTRVSSPVELLDIFPTLTDLAGLPAVEKCPVPSSQRRLCTEGKSLKQVISKTSLSEEATFSFAFSQYPRPSLHPRRDSDKPRLKKIKYMGYSVRSRHYRYTEWVVFDNTMFRPDWTKVMARELYDHVRDPEENDNQSENVFYKNVRAILSKILHEQAANST